MYIGVQHRIKDADAAMARGQKMLENTEPGLHVHQFCPSTDLAVATCVWEADSVDSVRDFVDGTLGDSSDNSYFEISTENAVGLPQAGART